MRLISLMSIGLVACHSGDSNGVARTAFITRERVLETRLEASCSTWTAPRIREDASVPQAYGTSGEARCFPRSDFGGDFALHVAWIGNEFLSSPEGSEICALHIGPDHLQKPLKSEVLTQLLRDLDTRAKAEEALAGIPNDHAYGVT